MTDQNIYSDEMLNAYIDGELDDNDSRRLLEQLQHDAELSERLAHLRQVSDMLKMSYAGIEPPEQCEPCQRWRMPSSMVAGILLVVGVSVGWVANSSIQPHAPFPALSQQQPENGAWRIVMHVNTVDEYMQNAMLEETETFLKAFDDSGQKVEVEIVAYGAGLSLLMADRTAHAKRISNLQNRYSNLTFTACKRSIIRIAEIQDDDVELLPKTQVAPSGISQILKRQQEGWHYIRL